MKPVTREQWIAALRSGEYKQCTGKLYRPGEEGGYCCLGVLGVLAGARRVDNEGCLSGLEFDVDDTSEIYGAYLPQTIADSVGIYSQQTLSDMNDKGMSFEEIADYIDSLPRAEEQR
jgi:hypothetical protein